MDGFLEWISRLNPLLHFVYVLLFLFASESVLQTAHRYATVAYPIYMMVTGLMMAVTVVLMYYVRCNHSISEFTQVKHGGVGLLFVGYSLALMHMLFRIFTVLNSTDAAMMKHVFSLDTLQKKLMWLLSHMAAVTMLYCATTVLYNQNSVCY